MINKFVLKKTYSISAVEWDGSKESLSDIESITEKRSVEMKQEDFNMSGFRFEDNMNYIVHYDGSDVLYVSTSYGLFCCNKGDYVARMYDENTGRYLSSVIRKTLFEETYKPANYE